MFFYIFKPEKTFKKHLKLQIIKIFLHYFLNFFVKIFILFVNLHFLFVIPPKHILNVQI